MSMEEYKPAKTLSEQIEYLEKAKESDLML